MNENQHISIRPGIYSFGCIAMALLFISACSEANVEAFPPLQFSVDDSLISEPIIFDEQNIKLCLPADSDKLSEQDLEAFRNAVQKDTSAYISTAPLLAARTDNDVFVVLSQVLKGSEVLKNLDENHIFHIESRYPNSIISRSQFSVNGIRTVQYLITNDTNVSFKLFCFIDDKCTQIDYLIPRNRYSELVRNIESSIGSITPKDEENPQ